MLDDVDPVPAVRPVFAVDAALVPHPALLGLGQLFLLLRLERGRV